MLINNKINVKIYYKLLLHIMFKLVRTYKRVQSFVECFWTNKHVQIRKVDFGFFQVYDELLVMCVHLL